MEDLLQQNVGPILSALIAIVLTWIFKGSLIKAQTKNAEASALEVMQKAYDRYVEHHNSKLNQMDDEIQLLKKELMRVEVFWKNKYDTLLRDFKAYKKKQNENSTK